MTRGTVAKATRNGHILSLDELLGKDDLPEEVVFVPEWDASVRIKAMTKGKVFDLREQSMPSGPESMDERRFELLLLVHGVVEPELSPDHVGVLQQKNNAAIDTILKAILRLNGMDAEAENRAKARFPAR